MFIPVIDDLIGEFITARIAYIFIQPMMLLMEK